MENSDLLILISSIVLYDTKQTQRNDRFFLIGSSNARFGRNPPTLRQILQIVLHKNATNKNLRENIKDTLDDLVIYYETQGIKTMNVYKLIDKVEKVHTEWRNLCKNKTSSSNTQIERREKFTTQLDQVFEIERNELKTKSVHTQTDQTSIEDIVKERPKRISENTEDTGNTGITAKQMRLDENEGNNSIICNCYARLLIAEIALLFFLTRTSDGNRKFWRKC